MWLPGGSMFFFAKEDELFKFAHKVAKFFR